MAYKPDIQKIREAHDHLNRARALLEELRDEANQIEGEDAEDFASILDGDIDNIESAEDFLFSNFLDKEPS